MLFLHPHNIIIHNLFKLVISILRVTVVTKIKYITPNSIFELFDCFQNLNTIITRSVKITVKMNSIKIAAISLVCHPAI